MLWKWGVLCELKANDYTFLGEGYKLVPYVAAVIQSFIINITQYIKRRIHSFFYRDTIRSNATNSYRRL
jgi:hypothetical protein